jgi:hypothetical protein
VRVDHVEGPAATELESAPEAHRQVRGHRWNVRDGELAPEEHRHAHDAHAVLDAIRRKAEGPRSQNGDVVAAAGELGGHGRHDHAPATTNRRILVIAEQNLHADPFGKLRDPVRVSILRARSVASSG